MTRREQRRIIWAVDPFAEDKSVTLRTIRFLRKFATKTKSAVKPVFVLPVDRANSEWFAEAEKAAAKALRSFMKKARIAGSEPPKILRTRAMSMRGAIRELVTYAESVGAETIVTGSHSRTGIGRVVLGSFAETLLLVSRVPCVVIGRKEAAAKRAGKILFPTDFNPESRKGFERVVDLALKLGVSVEILHQIDDPVFPLIQEGAFLFSGAYLPSPMPADRRRKATQAEADQWVRWARERGAKASAKVLLPGPHVVDSIVKAAGSSDCSMVAMVSRQGPAGAVVLGSIAREVTRASPRPVWVLHPLKSRETERTP